VLTCSAFFLLGYFMGCDVRFRAVAERQRLMALAVRIAASSALDVLTTRRLQRIRLQP